MDGIFHYCHFHYCYFWLVCCPLCSISLSLFLPPFCFSVLSRFCWTAGRFRFENCRIRCALERVSFGQRNSFQSYSARYICFVAWIKWWENNIHAEYKRMKQNIFHNEIQKQTNTNVWSSFSKAQQEGAISIKTFLSWHLIDRFAVFLTFAYFLDTPFEWPV